MVNLHFKRILILGLLTVSFNTNAQTDKNVLMQRCRDLSENIISLVYSQGRSSCVEKLSSASMEVEAAGDWIMADNPLSAKQELEHAMFSLQYAELNSCNRYIQISHAKLEAQKIRNLL
ncbi:hypothetical protein [Legionella sp. km772]|uniref:hypothetical protein n=1 Tax=Legionella sp. km772 TaxID=2498111 RepID=UPI000F8C7A45|nr:hypothetical protein [Legionella sp. km772]RUR05288.1 hypothetical protein ELY15_14470 [Legionella sp. km772]